MALLCAGIAVHLIRRTEPVQVVVAAALVAVLLLGRHQFVGRPEPRSRSAIPLGLLAIAFAGWLLGAITIVAEHHALARPWTDAQVLEQSFLGLIGISGPLRFRSAAAAAESSYVLLGLGILAGLAALAVLLR